MKEQAIITNGVRKKRDADYVFYELTRSICPDCRRVINALILLRDNKVYMRKRCPAHGPGRSPVATAPPTSRNR